LVKNTSEQERQPAGTARQTAGAEMVAVVLVVVVVVWCPTGRETEEGRR
jgi:hypothetical protein